MPLSVSDTKVRMKHLHEGKCRVLVVDDNKDNADSIALLLKIEEGYEVCIAYDGAQALEQFEGFDPEVALLDLAMPKINGYDLARTFRERKPAIKLVAMTGLTSGANAQRSRDAGFDHHLVKPFDPKELQRVVRRDCAIVHRGAGG
jgi:CheY-like chemotaxis protein